jgi:hypothetical protein
MVGELLDGAGEAELDLTRATPSVVAPDSLSAGTAVGAP